MKNQEYNAWGDAFVMKHSAKLMGSGFIIVFNEELCEELRYLDTYSLRDRYGLKRSAERWFEVIQKTIQVKGPFQSDDDTDLWNPLVNINISNVDRADRNIGRAKYTSINKLFIEENKRNE